MASQAQNPLQLLPLDEAEALAWGQLHRRLRQLHGFGLLVYLVHTPALANRLQVRLSAHLQERGQLLVAVQAVHPENFAENALKSLLREAPANAGAFWIDLHREPGQPEWDAQRRVLLARLNERRSRLEAEVTVPLILLLPAGGVAEAAAQAPDLWHVRVLTENLACDEGAIPAVGLPPGLQRVPRSFLFERDSAAVQLAHEHVQAWLQQWQGAFGSTNAVNLTSTHPALQSLSIDDGNRAVIASLQLDDIDTADRIAEDVVALARWRLASAEAERLDRARFELSAALDSLGHVAMATSRWEPALIAFTEGLGLVQHLSEQSPESPSASRAVAVSLENVARAHAARRDWVPAMAAARESVRISRCLTEDGIDLFGTRLRELAISLDLAGEIALLSSSLDEAKDCFGESIELRRRMIQKWGPRLAKEREMLLPMVGLVRVAREQRDWVAAQRIGRGCLEIARRWVDASKRSPESLNDLAMALIVNLDLPDAPGDTLREEARHVVAELRARFPNWQQNVELEAALQSSDNRS